MDIQMTSTTFEIPGYRVTRGLGVVKGITVRSAGWWDSSPRACAPSSAARSTSMW